jgi:ankyrin repeat protein
VQWGENVNGNGDTYGQPLNRLIKNQLVTDESPILDFLEKYQSQLMNSINKCRFFGYTYLLLTIEWNRPKTVQKLLEMGSNPNMTDMGFNYTTRYGVAGGMSYSPLMLAILQLPHVVPLLLQYGADPCVVVNNDTALIYACYHNEIDIIKYMLDNTNVIETLEIVDVDGYTAINYLDHKIKAVSGECTDPEIIYESIISTKIKEMLLDATYEIHKTPKIHKLLSLLLLLYSLIISFSF